MKQIFLLTLLVLMFQSGFSQDKISPTLWKAFVSIGYGSTRSDNLSGYYDALVDNYRSSALPVRTQREFGPTLLVNASIICNLLENIGAGISFGYLFSPAYSNYKDYAGTLKINGSINCYEILLKTYYIPGKVGNFSIIISPQIGVSHSSVIMTEEVRFSDFQQYNYDWKMSKSGWGPCAQATIGASINLGKFIIALEGGFRYSRIQVIEQTEESTSGTTKVLHVTDLGLNGFVSDLSFGINL